MRHRDCMLILCPLQGLAYTGYISVNWTTVHKDVIKRLDVNQSGKFDASDVKALTASALAVLSQVGPCPAGLAAHTQLAWGFALPLYTTCEAIAALLGQKEKVGTRIASNIRCGAGRAKHRRVLCGVPAGAQVNWSYARMMQES